MVNPHKNLNMLLVLEGILWSLFFPALNLLWVDLFYYKAWICTWLMLHQWLVLIENPTDESLRGLAKYLADLTLLIAEFCSDLVNWVFTASRWSNNFVEFLIRSLQIWSFQVHLANPSRILVMIVAVT